MFQSGLLSFIFFSEISTAEPPPPCFGPDFDSSVCIERIGLVTGISYYFDKKCQ